MKKYEILRGAEKGRIVESEEKRHIHGFGRMIFGIEFKIQFGKCTLGKYDSNGNLNYKEV